MVRFEDKTVIVTGGNRGIGRAIVERFASEGADVLVTGRNEETIAATVAAVEAAGGRASGLRADVCRDDDLRRSHLPVSDSRSDIADRLCRGFRILLRLVLLPLRLAGDLVRDADSNDEDPVSPTPHSVAPGIRM